MDFLRQFDRETCVNVAQLIKLKSYVKQTDGDYQCYWMQPIRTNILKIINSITEFGPLWFFTAQ